MKRPAGVGTGEHSSGGATGTTVPRERIDVPALVAETRFSDWLARNWEPPNRDGFTRCPNERAHKNGHDKEPWANCKVYADGPDPHLFCFACSARYSLIDLAIELGHAHDFLTAVRYFEEYAGRPAPTRSPAARPQARKEAPKDVARRCTREPVPDALAARYWSRVGQQLGEPLVAVLQGRGFEIEDRATLGLTHGRTASTARDGFFPTLDPRGLIVTVRRRFADPGDGPKYKPAPGFKGDENPAWCSPCVDCGDLLVIEGELSGMAAWLALDGQAAVMGMNATTGSLWYEALAGRDVYIYGDDGAPGQAAKQRWARTAYLAGAHRVSVYPAWPDGDACDIAGQHGRGELRARLE